jgi:hypothetical protein
MRREAVAVAPEAPTEAGSSILRGRVVSINPVGEILVERESGGRSAVCDVLRTTAAQLPALREGDEVLFVYDADRQRGCVLGVVQKYLAEPTPSQVKIEAVDRIELRCGTSTVTMTREGAVLVKGQQIVSRASGVNKIKGAAVKIN